MKKTVSIYSQRLLTASIFGGLTGGTLAGVLLAMTDVWLTATELRELSGSELGVLLAYAILLSTPLCAFFGVLAGLSMFLIGWIVRTRESEPRRCSTLMRAASASTVPSMTFCLSFGLAVLIRYGYLPHWYRADRGTPKPGTLWADTALTLGAAVLFLLLLGGFLLLKRRRTAAVPSARSGGWWILPILPILIFGTALGSWWWLSRPSDGSSSAVATGVPRIIKIDPAGSWAGGGKTAGEVIGPAEADAPDRDRRGASGNEAEDLPVILILIDTLRWDALSCYGCEERLTPHLDRFSRESVLFRIARAQASWTKPSIATMLTSVYPADHGASRRIDRLKPSVVTLAQIFHQGGYRTGAVVANGNISPALGFDRGFDRYHYLKPQFPLGASGLMLKLGLYRMVSVGWHLVRLNHRQPKFFKRTAPEVNQASVGWLEECVHDGEERFFLFLSYIDPHDPYFQHPYDGRAIGSIDDKAPPGSKRDVLNTLYRGEVAFTDYHLGVFFSQLQRMGLYDRSLIVVTSDHGEEFQDHGGWWHGQTLFEEQIRVPLLVRFPGGSRRGRLTEPAGLIDLAPSLISFAGLQQLLPSTMQGRPLFTGPNEQGNEAPATGMMDPTLFFAEEELDGNVLTSVVEGRWKYIRANRENPRGLPVEALYDLELDPAERNNLAASSPGTARRLARRLDDLDRPAARGRSDESTELDPETEEHLRALGYLEDSKAP